MKLLKKMTESLLGLSPATNEREERESPDVPERIKEWVPFRPELAAVGKWIITRSDDWGNRQKGVIVKVTDSHITVKYSVGSELNLLCSGKLMEGIMVTWFDIEQIEIDG